MQDDLFGLSSPTPPPQERKARSAKATASSGVKTVEFSPEMVTLGQSLPSQLRMGVSTWSYPGWEGLVWEGAYDASVLSRKGLGALSQHPLMRTVCVDRTFWRPLSQEQYAQMADQVPPDFRFVVKCPNAVTDALVRDENGQGQKANPVFLNAQVAVDQFVVPACAGLQEKLGVLVFQISPLSWEWLQRLEVFFERLGQMLQAVHQALASELPVTVAVEVRDPMLLQTAFVQTLVSNKATYCLGLHGKMPPIEQQLGVLRQLWPTPLVCRWNLNPVFGPFGYPEAQHKHAPFNAIRSADPHTRQILAKTIAGITGAGHPAFVTISNDAEGCAPLSIAALAHEIQRIR